MTLAIAVQYPFGRLREAFESLSRLRPLRWQKAIIFLTDSRWTFPDNHYEDNGMKLYDISSQMVLAYSGLANIAEQFAINLTNRLNVPSNKPVDVTSIFRRTYSHHKRHNDKIGVKTDRLSFLLGSYLKSGETKLVKLESPEFKPNFVLGIEGMTALRVFCQEMASVSSVTNEIRTRIYQYGTSRVLGL